MCVCVDEAGQDAAALGVEVEAVGREVDCPRQLRLAADPHDDAVFRRQSAVGDDAEPLVRRGRSMVTSSEAPRSTTSAAILSLIRPTIGKSMPASRTVASASGTRRRRGA